MRAAFSLLIPSSRRASYCSSSLTDGPGSFRPGMIVSCLSWMLVEVPGGALPDGVMIQSSSVASSLPRHAGAARAIGPNGHLTWVGGELDETLTFAPWFREPRLG